MNLRSLDRPVKRFKHDCSVELIYSVNDYQCDTLCQGPGTYYSKNGACVNTVLKNIKESNVQNDCDPRLGVLAFIIGDTQFGTIRIGTMSEHRSRSTIGRRPKTK